jgi:hypothetical protein
MKRSLAVLLLSIPALACAQDLYKCRSADGKITYSNSTCASLRLQPAGEVKGQVSVTPAVKSPVSEARARPPAQAPTQPTAQAEPVKQRASADGETEVERRCFKTANGTRCNENPDRPK